MHLHGGEFSAATVEVAQVVDSYLLVVGYMNSAVQGDMMKKRGRHSRTRRSKANTLQRSLVQV
eukprot:6483306-Amphidinium_carterae.1